MCFHGQIPSRLLIISSLSWLTYSYRTVILFWILNTNRNVKCSLIQTSCHLSAFRYIMVFPWLGREFYFYRALATSFLWSIFCRVVSNRIISSWIQLHTWNDAYLMDVKKKESYWKLRGLTHGPKFVIWMIIPVKNNSNDKFLARVYTNLIRITNANHNHELKFQWSFTQFTTCKFCVCTQKHPNIFWEAELTWPLYLCAHVFIFKLIPLENSHSKDELQSSLQWSFKLRIFSRVYGPIILKTNCNHHYNDNSSYQFSLVCTRSLFSQGKSLVSGCELCSSSTSRRWKWLWCKHESSLGVLGCTWMYLFPLLSLR